KCLMTAPCPEKGTVRTITSHCATADALSVPSIFAEPPSRARRSLAVSAARWASREPMTTCSPAAAQRAASPEPSGPVPPRIPILLLMTCPLRLTCDCCVDSCGKLVDVVLERGEWEVIRDRHSLSRYL